VTRGGCRGTGSPWARDSAQVCRLEVVEIVVQWSEQAPVERMSGTTEVKSDAYRSVAQIKTKALGERSRNLNCTDQMILEISEEDRLVLGRCRGGCHDSRGPRLMSGE
jgi:hypothetical protein